MRRTMTTPSSPDVGDNQRATTAVVRVAEGSSDIRYRIEGSGSASVEIALGDRLGDSWGNRQRSAAPQFGDAQSSEAIAAHFREYRSNAST